MFEAGELVRVKDKTHKFYRLVCRVEDINCLYSNSIAIRPVDNSYKYSLFIHPDEVTEVESLNECV